MTRRNISLGKRYKVLRRDRFRCVYCGQRAGDVEMHIDHVTPVSLGGGNEMANLVAACSDCNLGKAGKKPDTRESPAGPAARHFLEGKYCIEWVQTDDDEPNGFRLNRWGLVKTVSDGYAWIQLFDNIMGDETHVVPIAISSLGPGGWTFYEQEDVWLEYAGKYWEEWARGRRALLGLDTRPIRSA